MTARGRKSDVKRPLWAQALDAPKDLDPPPAHLGKPERELWRRVVEEFGVENPIALALLASACEAAQRARECREQIAKDGQLVKGKGGVMKPHPLLGIERSARQQSVAALRKMGVTL